MSELHPALPEIVSQQSLCHTEPDCTAVHAVPKGRQPLPVLPFELLPALLPEPLPDVVPVVLPELPPEPLPEEPPEPLEPLPSLLLEPLPPLLPEPLPPVVVSLLLSLHVPELPHDVPGQHGGVYVP